MLNTSTATQKTAASVVLGSDQIRTLALGGMFMAMNIAVSSYGIPVPGGHLYLCDAVICTAAILLAPFPAMLVGGIGAFLGDMIFYPGAPEGWRTAEAFSSDSPCHTHRCAHYGDRIHSGKGVCLRQSRNGHHRHSL